MRPAALIAGVAAIAAALLTDATVAGQEAGPASAFVAFRLDADRVVATLRVTDFGTRQVTDGLSVPPRVRYGYPYFDLPAAWREKGVPDVPAGQRWLIHAAPGQTFEAEAERIVGGNAQCQDAIGVLLRVAPERSDAFAAVRPKYFLAQRSETLLASKARAGSTVGVARSPSTAEFQRALRSALDALLARELPQVRANAAPGLARMASSPLASHRSWARRWQAADDALQSGRGELAYDIQSFRLAPDGVLIHFVRAEWTVRRRQGFATTLWVRGDGPVEVIQTDLRPASWLRMSEFFRGGVAREHLGLILNVLDRDQDGWGEVLLAQRGYESTSLRPLEYSPAGFLAAGIEYAFGC